MAAEAVIDQFPHCDSRVLHGPEDGCEYCNRHPDWQELRRAWGIAFTGHTPKALLPECGQRYERYGRIEDCRRARGHDGDHTPLRELEQMPCPSDAARPPGAPNDHRRWGGNKPTSAAGDPSWPAESVASVMMYGDKGGRQRWPLPERIRTRLGQPLENRRMRKRGWRRTGGGWRYP